MLDMLVWVAEHPLAVFGFPIGAAVASFLCVVGERLPQGRPVSGRSVCACGEQLRAWRAGFGPENVPIVGWVWHRGRTHCGRRLPGFYLAAEVVLAVVFAVSGAAGPEVAAGAWLLASLVVAGAAAWRLGR